MVNLKATRDKALHLAEVGLVLAPVGLAMVNAQSSVLSNHTIKAHAITNNGEEAEITVQEGIIVSQPVDGYYEFCLDAGVRGPDGGQTFTETQWDTASKIAAFGRTSQNKNPLFDFGSLSMADQYLLTQLTIWRYTNPINQAEGGSGKPANELLQTLGWSAMAESLYNTSRQHQDPNIEISNANANAQQKADEATNNAKVSLAGDVTNKLSAWKDSATASMSAVVDGKINSELSSGVAVAQSNAIKMVHFTNTSPVTADADKKALPNFEDGTKNKHSDSVKLGAHVFDMNLSHDDAKGIGNERTTVDFGTGAKIKFQSALPKDTVITNNGKTITKDASTSTDYDFNYGSVEIQVPFSDKPSEASDVVDATVQAVGTYTTLTYSEAASSDVTVSANGTVQGVSADKLTGMEIIQPGRQRFIIVVHSATTTESKPWSATASGSASASYASSGSTPWSQTVKNSLAMKWDSALTNLKIHKVDERGKALSGVTFELVQSSVVDSDVLTSGPGKYTLANGDGSLISLPKVTDKKGNVSWDNLAFPGVYTLLEIATNTGKVLASNPVDLTFDRYSVDNQNLTVVNKDGSLEVSNSLSSQSDETPSSSPAIHTTATGTNGTKLVLGAGKQNIKDTVTYSDLKPNTEYTVVGKWMDQDTGKEIGLTGEKTFTTTDKNGSVDVEFSADASKYAGKNIVAYEYLYNKDNKSSAIATHNDLKDSGQTLEVTKPEIHTTATVDGNKAILPNGQVNVKDTVEYKGLVKGVTMNLEGTPINKDNGDVIGNGGSQTFTPSDSNGTVDVNIKADASKMGQKGMVMYEKLHQTDKNGQIIAAHEDINDVGQSITRKPVTVNGVQNGGTPSLAKTATIDRNDASLFIAGALVISVSTAGIVLANKKRKEV